MRKYPRILASQKDNFLQALIGPRRAQFQGPMAITQRPVQVGSLGTVFHHLWSSCISAEDGHLNSNPHLRLYSEETHIKSGSLRHGRSWQRQAREGVGRMELCW